MLRSKLWDQRLGHIYRRGLVELSKRELLMGDRILDIEFYESYVVGKIHKVKFNHGVHTSKGVLYYAHLDLLRSRRV